LPSSLFLISSFSSLQFPFFFCVLLHKRSTNHFLYH
jgi:hypothetical protein